MRAVGLWVLFGSLAACAPAAMLAPPIPMGADQSVDISVGLTGMGPVAAPQEQCTLWGGCEGFSTQISGFTTLQERVDVGGVVYAGNSSGVGAGGFVRFWYVDSERFRLGGQLQGGWAWAAAGIPMAGRVHERVWITASPSIGVRSLSVLRLPVGVGVSLTERLWISGELAMGWDPWRVFQDPESVQLQGSVQLSWRPAVGS